MVPEPVTVPSPMFSRAGTTFAPTRVMVPKLATSALAGKVVEEFPATMVFVSVRGELPLTVTPPPLSAELLETVQCVNASVPTVSIAPPLLEAELPESVQCVSVAVPVPVL